MYKKLILPLFFISFSQTWASDRILIGSDDSTSSIIEKLRQLPEGRNKFALSGKTLAISNTNKKKPRHDELATYGDIITGGYISVKLDGNKVLVIEVDNYSGRLCPSFLSLQSVQDLLSPITSNATLFTLKNNPNTEKCN